MRSRRAFLKTLCSTAAVALSGRLLAQPKYPTKTIKAIAPVQPGGGVELVARGIEITE